LVIIVFFYTGMHHSIDRSKAT